MKAVFETGKSNLEKFRYVRPSDGVIKTGAGEDNTLLFGNEPVDNDTTLAAAMYVRGNAVGVRKVPIASVDLDVAGAMAGEGSLTMYQKDRFTDTFAPRFDLTAEKARFRLNERSRFCMNALGFVSSRSVASEEYLRPAAVDDDHAEVTVKAVQASVDEVKKRRKVTVSFGDGNEQVALRDDLDCAEVDTTLLRFGDTVYRVIGTEYEPGDGAGLRLTLEAHPAPPFSIRDTRPASADIDAAIMEEHPVDIRRILGPGDDDMRVHAQKGYYAYSHPHGTSVVSLYSERGYIELKCKDDLLTNTRLSDYVRVKREVMRVTDVHVTSTSYDVHLRSSDGSPSSSSSLAAVYEDVSSAISESRDLPELSSVKKLGNPEVRCAKAIVRVREHDTSGGFAILEMEIDTFTQDIADLLPEEEDKGDRGLGVSRIRITSRMSGAGTGTGVWIREAYKETSTTGFAVFRTYEHDDGNVGRFVDALRDSLFVDVTFDTPGLDVRCETSSIAADGYHAFLQTPPFVSAATRVVLQDVRGTDGTLVIGHGGRTRSWTLCQIQETQDLGMRLLLKRADGMPVSPDEDSFPVRSSREEAAGSQGALLHVSAFLSPRVISFPPGRSDDVGCEGRLTVGNGALKTFDPDSTLGVYGNLSILGADYEGVVFPPCPAKNADGVRWKIFADKNDRLRIGHNAVTIAKNGSARFQGDVHVQGELRGRGTLIPSDARLKSEVRPAAFVGGALDRIARMRVKHFVYDDDETHRTRTGIIAQELEGVLPSAVRDTGTMRHESFDEVEDIRLVFDDSVSDGVHEATIEASSMKKTRLVAGDVCVGFHERLKREVRYEILTVHVQPAAAATRITARRCDDTENNAVLLPRGTVRVTKKIVPSYKAVDTNELLFLTIAAVQELSQKFDTHVVCPWIK